MKKAKEETDGLARTMIWAPLVLVIIALVVGMALRSGVDEIAKDSTEMVRTVTHVDSVASLRTIIVTLNNQFVRAEDSWSQALSTLVFLLFIVSVIAVTQWFRLYHLHRQREHRRESESD